MGVFINLIMVIISQCIYTSTHQMIQLNCMSNTPQFKERLFLRPSSYLHHNLPGYPKSRIKFQSLGWSWLSEEGLSHCTLSEFKKKKKNYICSNPYIWKCFPQQLTQKFLRGTTTATTESKEVPFKYTGFRTLDFLFLLTFPLFL